jgi:hypothetical protein
MTSDKLHAADLQGRDHVVVIERVTQGEYTDHDGKRVLKPDVHFRGKKKPLGLNSTNARTIAKLFGSNKTEDWLGKAITIYPTTTMAFGEEHECIRVRPRLPSKDAANDNKEEPSNA